jgi:hypothetical protein
MTRTTLFALLIAAALPAAQAEDFVRTARTDAPRAATKAGPGIAAVTIDEVGDADSFGRNKIWLGLLSGYVQLAQDCTGLTDTCQTLAAAPGFTSFDFDNLDTLTLPGRSSHSLFCHSQTPIVAYSAHNSDANPQEFNFRVTPYYTIQSEVLVGLSDPNTGVPYNGEIELPLTGIFKTHTLASGASDSETLTGTRMCIGGLVSLQSLQDSWGLTEAQAEQFFRRPVTITLGIRGNARLVEDANINIGTRFSGD